MIYTPLTVKAMNVAYNAHHGQKDKAGAPYIFHPIHVAEQMEDETTTCIALLHDVLEDTSVTLAELEREFPKEVTEALKLLTRAPGTDYLEYVRKVKFNPAARAVKLADLAHNSDEGRLRVLPPAVRARLEEKYAKARAVLEEGA